MNGSEVIESLIYRAEDNSVEFKSEQYVIAKHQLGDELSVTEAKRRFEEKKSELLKDVLAIANAWRDGPGYIVIGAREVKGGVAEVEGVPEHLLFDDAAIQQFIGSHLAHPLQFTYSHFEYRGKKLCLITIPKQDGRPFFAKRSTGVVSTKAVYVRRGSMTAEADPTEIARMGRDEAVARRTADVNFIIHDGDGEPLANTSMKVLVPDFGSVDDLCDYEEPQGRGMLFPMSSWANPNFYRESAKVMQALRRALMVQVVLESRSNHPLRECKLELYVHDDQGVALEMCEVGDLPEWPDRHGLERDDMELPRLPAINASETMLIGKDGRAVFRFRLIRPGETIFAPDQFAIHVAATTRVHFEFRLLSEDLAQPISHKCQFHVEVQGEQWNVDSLKEALDRLEER